MGPARRSDDRPGLRSRAAWLVRLVRTRPRSSLLLLGASLALALGSPRWFGGGAAVGALVLAAFLTYGTGLVVLALAIAGDRNRPDTGGRRRAILAVLTGGLGAVPWALEERRERDAGTDPGGPR